MSKVSLRRIQQRDRAFSADINHLVNMINKHAMKIMELESEIQKLATAVANPPKQEVA